MIKYYNQFDMFYLASYKFQIDELRFYSYSIYKAYTDSIS